MKRREGTSRLSFLLGTRRRKVVLLLAATVPLAVLTGTMVAQAADPFAAVANVSPHVDYLNDTAGTAFTVKVKNTGTTATIGAVEIKRPDSFWTITGCSTGLPGWTVQRADPFCRFRSADATADDIQVASNGDFVVTLTSLPGTVDHRGIFNVTVSKSNKFDNPSELTAAPEGLGGLDITAHTFEVLDAVVANAPATPNSPCPPSNKDADTGSSHTIIVCGRNHASSALTPVAPPSSLSGTFIASPGTFSSGSIAANTSGSVVLGNWNGATIVNSSGPNKKIVAVIAASLNQTSPSTTLGGYTANNRPPTATDDGPYTAYEDQALHVAAPGVLGNDTDPEGQSLSASLVSGPSHGDATVNADGSFDYTGDADYNGPDSFVYQADDGHGGTDTATVSIDVRPVNDPPSFTLGGDQTAQENAGPQSVANFATDISAGPADESGQAVHFNVSNDNSALFSSQPAIDASGTLTYTPQVTASGGVATVSVEAQDDGGTANGGDDTSDAQTFTITVQHVNQAPTAGDVTFGTAVNNTLFTVGTTGSGPEVHVSGSVLDNSSDPDGPSPLTAVAGTIATTNGGTVHLNADGSFDYVSAAGYRGTADSFSFSVRDGAGEESAPATAHVNLSGHVVWYVDNAGAAGDGRSTSPLASLAPLQGASDPDGSDDTIFVYEGSGTYGGGIALESGQSLLGQPAGLDVDDLHVAGSGARPTITNASGDGVTVAGNTTIASVVVRDAADSGILGSGVGNVSISDAKVLNNGDSAAALDSGIRFSNLSGTSDITDTEVAGSKTDNVRIVNTSGSLDLTLSGDTIRDTATGSGQDGVTLRADATAAVTASVDASTVARNGPRGIEAVATGAGSLGLTVTNSTFTTNFVHVDVADNSSGAVSFRIEDNTATSATSTSTGINVFLSAGTPAGASLSGTISGNSITNTNPSAGPGIAVSGSGAGSVVVDITDNTVDMVNSRGIDVGATNGSAHVDATITGNTVHLSSPTVADRAILVQSGALSTDTTAVCADIRSNDAHTGTGLIDGIRVRNRFTGTQFRLPGYPDVATSDVAVVAYIVLNNPGTTASATHGTSAGFGGGAACASP